MFALSMADGKAFIQFNPKESQRYIGDAYLIGFKEVPRTVRLKNGKTKTLYDKDKKTLVLKPIAIMASAINEISGKVVMLNAQTD